ncbi:UDP-N-acetylmuramate dehydrogenase [Halobacteriovorax sp. HLS]|uniref:UDP-N-acetylmuramate dehydrogenase n=1 Tax=Halobacteriovorax sp. HLS TaxID=2234000 RepID=UPI000FD9C8A6|nr:FAD-binding protein [Halobacteriovorax sp. HLS]
MNLRELLTNIKDIELEEAKDLTKYSTMRLKAQGDLITVRSIEALKETLPTLTSKGISYRVLGLGANQLLPELSVIPFIKLALPFKSSYLDEVREIYELPASVTLSKLSSHAIKNGLSGWESFTGIPATLGGAVFMNAGTNLGEIGTLIREVRIINKLGELRVEVINETSFSYRKNHFLKEGDVVVSVSMGHLGVDPAITDKIKNYLDLRNRTQPLKEWTCGCIFENSKLERTCLAGKFIDILGLKGLSHNGLRISPKHANFMENVDNAGREDVVALIKIIKDELRLQYGVEFETEVKL